MFDIGCAQSLKNLCNVGSHFANASGTASEALAKHNRHPAKKKRRCSCNARNGTVSENYVLV
jgi:hypothetical protein